MSAELAVNPSEKEIKSVETQEMIALRIKIYTDLHANPVDNSVGSIPETEELEKVKVDILNATSIQDYYEKVKSLEEADLAAAQSVSGSPAIVKRKFEEVRQGIVFTQQDISGSTTTSGSTIVEVSSTEESEILSTPAEEFSFAADDMSYTPALLAGKGVISGSTQSSYEPTNNTTSESVSCDNLPTTSSNYIETYDLLLEDLLGKLILEDGSNIIQEEYSVNTSSNTNMISEYFKLEDLSSNAVVSKYTVQSQHGLTESQIICNLHNLAVNVLDKIKEKYPDIIITSAFRKGNTRSLHERGQAVDIQVSNLSPQGYFDMAKWISENVDYDQLLLEFKSFGSGLPWIHLSYNITENRNTVMTFSNNKKYSDGLKLVSY